MLSAQTVDLDDDERSTVCRQVSERSKKKHLNIRDHNFMPRDTIHNIQQSAASIFFIVYQHSLTCHPSVRPSVHPSVKTTLATIMRSSL